MMEADIVNVERERLDGVRENGVRENNMGRGRRDR